MPKKRRSRKNGRRKPKRGRKIGDRKLHALVGNVIAGRRPKGEGLVWHYVGPKRAADD